MPLISGFSKDIVSKNISFLREEGRGRAQSIAIALSKARESAKKTGKRPSHLFKKVPKK